MQYSKADRDRVVSLHIEKRHTAKKISALTGIAIEHVKFWIHAAKWVPKRKTVEGQPPPESYRTKFQDWESWVSKNLRWRFLKLAKQYHPTHPPPTRPEIEVWVRGLDMRCSYCLTGLTPKNFSVDHRLPATRGGTSAFANLWQCCKRCNDVKGTLTEQEFQALRALVTTWDDQGKSLFTRLRGGFIPSHRR